jgi:hypothetical protein
MTPSTDASVTWNQALAWRLERHLLDPVGPHSVAGVVRRLGAVLSMDESLAELAVRIRREESRRGELAKCGSCRAGLSTTGSRHLTGPTSEPRCERR